jgi:uncharacterized OB-fold protein
MSIRNKAAVVGIGETPTDRLGSKPGEMRKSRAEYISWAMRLALEDAGLSLKDFQGQGLGVTIPTAYPQPEAKPFWDAAAQNKLVMQDCNDCGAWVWTPRPLCNECGSERVEWTPMSGKGEIYSFTVIRQVVGRAASQAFAPDIPYVIAWVDLDEGPRMITNIVSCPVEEVKLGMKVSVLFEQASKDIWLPKFKPVSH